MSIILPQEILICIKTIEHNGFEAFCVGGAVRDHIMNCVPGDYDITTNALPQDIMSMFEKTVPTGIKHGTVTVIINNFPIEVTTYRTEGGYSDHRKPDEVTFVSDIQNDLRRRDFTMNAICYNPKTGIFDPLNGIDDIKNETVRAIGDPFKRFNEDALRIMRAFRFSCQLGFEIEKHTLNSALKMAFSLKNISAERIAVELIKIVISDYPEKINPLLLSGSLSFVGITENASINKDFKNYPCDFPLRFSLFCLENKLNAVDILTNLKLDNYTKTLVGIYTKMSELNIENESDIRRLLNLGDYKLTKIYLIYKAPELLPLLEKIFSRGDAYKISMLAISGNELVAKGVKGKNIGIILETLLSEVIENPNCNNYEFLITRAQDLINK